MKNNDKAWNYQEGCHSGKSRKRTRGAMPGHDWDRHGQTEITLVPGERDAVPVNRIRYRQQQGIRRHHRKCTKEKKRAKKREKSTNPCNLLLVAQAIAPFSLFTRHRRSNQHRPQAGGRVRLPSVRQPSSRVTGTHDPSTEKRQKHNVREPAERRQNYNRREKSDANVPGPTTACPFDSVTPWRSKNPPPLCRHAALTEVAACASLNGRAAVQLPPATVIQAAAVSGLYSDAAAPFVFLFWFGQLFECWRRVNCGRRRFTGWRTNRRDVSFCRALGKPLHASPKPSVSGSVPNILVACVFIAGLSPGCRLHCRQARKMTGWYKPNTGSLKKNMTLPC